MNGALVIRLAGFIFVACVVSVGAGEAVKNPYLTSKVGDWVKYRMVGEGGEHKVDMIVKKTVQSVTAKEVVIEEEFTVEGKVVNTRKATVDLTAPYSLRKDGKTAKVTLDKNGSDKLTVAKTTLQTTWTLETRTDSIEGVEMSDSIKTWFSPEVPLDGMVKCETAINSTGAKLPPSMPKMPKTLVFELVEFGRK